MTSSELTKQRNKFIALKKDVSSIILNLNKSIECSSKLINVLNDNFKYDDIIADKNFNEKNKDSIKDIVSKLNNSVIPAIDAKISELKRDIREAIASESVMGMM